MREIATYYHAHAIKFERQPVFVGSQKVDVAIVGGGFTGIGAALELARRGLSVALLEQSTIGNGATGRNGGQSHPHWRREMLEIERLCGRDLSRAMWDFSQNAQAYFLDLIEKIGTDSGYCEGIVHVAHRPSDLADLFEEAEHLQNVYSYNKISLLDRKALKSVLATDAYCGGTFDSGGGHLNPLNVCYSVANWAIEAGANLYEQSSVLRIQKQGGLYQLITEKGVLSATKVILAGGAYMHGLSPIVEAHILPIRNYIAVTEPLGENEAKALITNGAAVSDSRFVVYYFRTTADYRLLFGGGETYTNNSPQDIAGFVRPHIAKIFPQLRSVRIDYAWGGTLGVTVNRLPYVKQPMPNLWAAGGYSGQGVMLAPFIGKMLGEAAAGDNEALATPMRIPTTKFPGGRLLARPLAVAAMAWFALRDRLG